eukprot:161890_1
MDLNITLHHFAYYWETIPLKIAEIPEITVHNTIHHFVVYYSKLQAQSSNLSLPIIFHHTPHVLHVQLHYPHTPLCVHAAVIHYEELIYLSPSQNSQFFCSLE